MSRKKDEMSQETEDAIVNLIAGRLVEKGAYQQALKAASARARKLIEDSLDRHAARRRAAGEKGW
jgi:hypothetical protein